MRPVRAHEWTAEKKRRFLEELASTCNVAASLRAVKMGSGSLYTLQKRDAGFRAEWSAALREGYAKLEVMLLDRALNGTVKTVTRADGSVDKTHEYPNAIALSLLKMHRETAIEADVEYHPEEIEAARRRIMRKVKAVQKRLDAAAPAPGQDGEEAGKRAEIGV